MKKLVVITGVSQGIGRALVDQFLSESFDVWGIGRREPVGLGEHGSNQYRHWSCDLSQVDTLAAWARTCFHEIPEIYEEIYFIHNAGTLQPMDLVGKYASETLISHIHLNVTAVMILTNEWVRHWQSSPIRKRMLVVSSGAGKNPYLGWSAYCTGKSAVDMYVRVVAEEQKEREFPIEIVSFAPGIVDTAMQEQIRSTPKDQFPLLEKFVELKEIGALALPHDVAPPIYTYLTSDVFENGQVVDIRDLNIP